MRRHLLALVLSLVAAAPATAADGPTVRFATTLGDIDVRLFGEDAPNTVATFLRYVADRSYDGTYFHRSVRDFIIQGGGYRQSDGRTSSVDEILADTDPFNRSNRRGTLATAKLPGQPNRSTSQWFFNLDDNGSLDAHADNYTVFGRVDTRSSLRVIDAIGALPIIDAGGGNQSSAFGELPVRDYTSGAIEDRHLIYVDSVTIVGDPRPPYALPFKLARSMIRVRRRRARVRVTVRRLRDGTNLRATIGGRLKAIATAPSGRAVMRFSLARRKRRPRLRITATPPGERASAVVIRLRSGSA